MQPLSAFDAISPAFVCTRAMLFQPFRAGRSWKLAASAYLARAGAVFLPFPLVYLLFLPAAERAGGVRLALLLIAGAVGVTLVLAVLFYLCTRMQFVVMDLVLERGEFVAPAWRRYGPQSRSWTGFKMVLGTVVTLIVAVPMVSYGRRLVSVAALIKPGEPPPPEFLLALLTVYGVFLLVFGSFFLLSSVMQDVVLPPMALAGASATAGLREGWAAVRREAGAFALFALVKAGLLVLGTVMLTIAFEILLLLVAAVGVGVGLLLHLAGVPTAGLLVIGIATGVVVYLGGFGYVFLLGIGAVSLLVEAHALYFLGGRFPRVGEMLDRTEAPAAYPPPRYRPPPPPPPFAAPPVEGG